MALVQRIILKLKPSALIRTPPMNYSTESSIKKSVFISQSKDIYTNLALQEWILENLNLTERHVLMLWQNDPCITIGKNQNPWQETNFQSLPHITDLGVKLARQKTDGSSMYHDDGNLNMTFFTPKERFNQKYNMEVIGRALFREYSLKVNSNTEELTLRNDYNISGNTKKLGKTNSYHQCSLLVKVNKVDFTQSLMNQKIGILQENGIKTKKSNIMNLCEENHNVTVKNLLKIIGWEYMRTSAFVVRDGGNQLANKQIGYQMINPTESWFPGISKIRESLTKWDWIYGQTPDFKVARNFHLPENVCNHLDNEFSMKMVVSGGIIKDVTFSVPSSLSTGSFHGEVCVMTRTLIGRQFSPDLLENLEHSLKNLVDDKEKIASDYFREVVSSF